MKQWLLMCLVFSSFVHGDDLSLEEGHSMHGEAFNVGPRQSAVLIDGTGSVAFPVSTQSELAQKFFDQGIGQIHGYWDFEAERSFRQAASLDSDCAMAYWGMAMANYKNDDRGKGFIDQAMLRGDLATEKERLWIECLADYFDKAKGDLKSRRRAIAKSFEQLMVRYPDDIEAKAFYIRWIYQNSRKGIPIKNNATFQDVADEILAENASHPAHHYVIHFWDHRTPATGLSSAEVCGQSAPGVAHMWHMPSHIYSKLKRYNEAVWFQEASARVDHAHLIKFHLLPDQIHNFAHNNEWLVRNLTYVGRCREAISLAKNMIEMPRVPKFDTDDDDSSYNPAKSSWQHGRRHLKNMLVHFEKWDELLSLENTPYLEVDGRAIKNAELEKLLTIARLETGQLTRAFGSASAIKKRSDAEREIAIYEALNAVPPDLRRARELLARIRSIDKARHALLCHRAKDHSRAVSKAREAVKSSRGRVYPLAVQTEVLFGAGKVEEAKSAYQALHKISGEADCDLPIFRRLAEFVEEFDLPQITDFEASAPVDVPDLGSLGPFRWSPPVAPDFEHSDFSGETHRLSDRRGKATLLIFYLGKGCIHCMEQLNEFSPAMAKYQEAGIDIIAISSDTQARLAETFAVSSEGSNSPFAFPLLSDSSLETFKKYRAFDDFEKQPLHGTFLIDAEQKIRWQDIGFEPFMYSDWLLEECIRLLETDSVKSS